MEDCVNTVTIRDARELSRFGELQTTKQQRWNALMNEIKEAATKGFWTLATVTDMDMIIELQKLGYQVEHIKGASWYTATRALISWK